MTRSLTLHTPRLVLHPITEADFDGMCRILTNPQIAKTFMLPDYPDASAVRKAFERYKELSADPERFVYGISLNGAIIGFINQVEIAGQTIELGYVIHPDHHCKGYATETLLAAMAELFKLGYTTVKTGAFEENTASIRVMQKCGMTPTGETEIIGYRGKNHLCIYYEKHPE